MKKLFILWISLFAIASGSQAELPPERVQIECDQVKIELLRHSFWNLNGIWYRGIQAGRTDGGAWYGTTTRFGGKGFVGSGHLETGVGEEEVETSFFVDGKRWTPTAGVVHCRSFEMRKGSLIDKMHCQYTIHLEKNLLREHVKVRFQSDAAGILYLFMHPWLPVFTEYHGQNRHGEIIRGSFSSQRTARLKQEAPEWLAFHSPDLQFGFVSALNPIKPFDEKDAWTIAIRGADRKVYYVVSLKKTFPKDSEFEWEMMTGFFHAGPTKEWQEEAQEFSRFLKSRFQIPHH